MTAIGSDDEMMDVNLLDLEACLPPPAIPEDPDMEANDITNYQAWLARE